MKRTLTILGLCLSAVLSACWVSRSAVQQGQRADTTPVRAPTVASAQGGAATRETVAAAQAFLATLDDAGRAKIGFPFDSAQKSKWSNFPVGVYPRNGVRWGDLSPAQRDAALKLLSVALSKQGLQKVREIMEGDEVLRASETGHDGPRGEGVGRRGPSFGRDEYYLALLGAPSLTDPWMIQFCGHHLAINLTIVGKDQVLTPSLPAAQPATYELDGQVVRPLGRERDESFALINSLDAAQQKKAILAYQVSNLVLGPGQDGRTVAPEGIKASDLNDAQQRMLLDLVHEWVGIVNEAAAAAKMAEVGANLPETWFAWSGPTTNDGSAYFRIQGPTLWIEYSPQPSRGSSGPDVNHVHTIYRDPTNDYGARLLKR